jgi:hypothetical protein
MIGLVLVSGTRQTVVRVSVVVKLPIVVVKLPIVVVKLPIRISPSMRPD